MHGEDRPAGAALCSFFLPRAPLLLAAAAGCPPALSCWQEKEAEVVVHAATPAGGGRHLPSGSSSNRRIDAACSASLAGRLRRLAATARAAQGSQQHAVGGAYEYLF